MSLFGLRGGQPFYAMYQASKMPEMQSPQGLYSYISLSMPKTTSKTTKTETEKEKQSETNASYFPGTEGARKDVSAINSQLGAVYNNNLAYLKNEYSAWLKQGKDPKAFMQREDIQQKAQQGQQLVYQQQQVESIKADSNEDLNLINATEKATKTFGDIVTRDVNGYDFPMLYKNGMPSNFDEYYTHERTRSKIYEKQDENGKPTGVLGYSKFDRPAMIETSGAFDAYARGILSDASASEISNEGVQQRMFNPSGQDVTIYGMHVTNSSNRAAVEASMQTLKNQLTQEARTDADRNWWADVRGGSAAIYDPTTGKARGITTEEMQEFDDYFNGKITDPEKQKEIMAKTVSSLDYNRLAMLEERRQTYIKSSHKETFGAKLYNQQEFNKNQPAEGFYTRYAEGKAAPNEADSHKYAFKFKGANGLSKYFRGENLVWNAMHEADVQAENKYTEERYKSGNPIKARDNLGTTIRSANGEFFSIDDLGDLDQFGLTGVFLHIPTNSNLRGSGDLGYFYDPTNPKSVEALSNAKEAIEGLKSEKAGSNNPEAIKNWSTQLAQAEAQLQNDYNSKSFKEVKLTGSKTQMKNAFEGYEVYDQNGKMVDLGKVVDDYWGKTDLTQSEVKYLDYLGFYNQTVPGATEEERTNQLVFRGGVETDQTIAQTSQVTYGAEQRRQAENNWSDVFGNANYGKDISFDEQSENKTE